jgi:hypothetical protein
MSYAQLNTGYDLEDDFEGMFPHQLQRCSPLRSSTASFWTIRHHPAFSPFLTNSPDKYHPILLFGLYSPIFPPEHPLSPATCPRINSSPLLSSCPSPFLPFRTSPYRLYHLLASQMPTYLKQTSTTVTTAHHRSSPTNCPIPLYSAPAPNHSSISRNGARY